MAPRWQSGLEHTLTRILIKSILVCQPGGICSVRRAWVHIVVVITSGEQGRMVVEVCADTREIGNDINSERFQHLLRSDTGQLKEFRSVGSTRGEDDFLAG